MPPALPAANTTGRDNFPYAMTGSPLHDGQLQLTRNTNAVQRLQP
jgi:hypothetical protein